MKLSRTQQNMRGSILVEAMVGVSLVIVGILGMIGLVIRSLQANDVVVNRFVAANLGAEGVEIMKNFIDKEVANKVTWTNIQSELSLGPYGVAPTLPNNMMDPAFSGATLCLEGGAYVYDNNCSGNGGVQTVFRRSVAITAPSPSSTAVTATVSWTTRGSGNSLQISDIFWAWR